jgi:hypothetical protein
MPAKDRAKLTPDVYRSYAQSRIHNAHSISLCSGHGVRRDCLREVAAILAS